MFINYFAYFTSLPRRRLFPVSSNQPFVFGVFVAESYNRSLIYSRVNTIRSAKPSICECVNWIRTAPFLKRQFVISKETDFKNGLGEPRPDTPLPHRGSTTNRRLNHKASARLANLAATALLTYFTFHDLLAGFRTPRETFGHFHVRVYLFDLPTINFHVVSCLGN